MDKVKKRFVDMWRVTFSFLSLIILFDLVVQFTSGTFSIKETLIVFAAVVVLAVVIAALLTLALPLLHLLSNPLALIVIAIVSMGAMYVYFGWWGFGGTAFVSLLLLSASFGSNSGGSGNDDDSSSANHHGGEDAGVTSARNTLRAYEITKTNDPRR